MNALYTHALRQTSSITSDLQLLENSLRGSQASTNGGEGGSGGSGSGPGPSSYHHQYQPPAALQGNGVDTTGLNGQIVASLAALQRTVDDYENMARRELVEANKGKAANRAERIRNDYAELKKQYDKLKQTQATQANDNNRAALLSTSVSAGGGGGATMQRRTVAPPSSHSYTSTTAESPFSLPPRPHSQPSSSSSTRGSRSLYTPRTDRALDEHSFLNDTGSQLDMFIAQGQAVLGNLGSQRDVLKGTQRRLLSAANTLGLSRNTINFIERRSKGDMAVLIAGAIFTLVCFVAILRYLG